MPTAKPRVQVTLTESAHATLSRISRAQGRSRSAVLSELFEAVQPALEKVAELMEAAASAPKDTLQRFRDALEGTEGQLSRIEGVSLGQMDLLLHGLSGGVGKGRKPISGTSGASAESAPSPSSTPVPVTRGSGHPKRVPRLHSGTKSPSKKASRTVSGTRRRK